MSHSHGRSTREKREREFYIWRKITISYGDRGFLIHPKIRIEENSFGLWEILKANDKDYIDIADQSFVFSKERIDSVLRNQARMLQDTFSLFEDMSEETVKKINENRENRDAGVEQ
jgi:hypothetical protein